jgi:hypothetical protein
MRKQPPADLLPLGESAVEDEQVGGRKPEIEEVEEDARRQVGAALVVDDDLPAGADAP